jgi:hypothetical protein
MAERALSGLAGHGRRVRVAKRPQGIGGEMPLGGATWKNKHQTNGHGFAQSHISLGILADRLTELACRGNPRGIGMAFRHRR